MSSLIEHPPRVRANASSEKPPPPENGFTSPPHSSLGRRPRPTPPTSPDAVKCRPSHRPSHRPQISIEQADYSVSSTATSDQDSGSTMHGSRSSSVADITDPGHPVPPLDQNIASFTRLNGHGHPANNDHLQVRPRTKKSHTLPNDLAYTGCLDGLQSEPNSLYNSSEAECDSDESSSVRDPRELLQNERYWRNNSQAIMPLLASSDKLRRQETRGGLEGKDEEELEVEEEEEGVEDGFDELDEYMSNSEGSGDEQSGSTAPSFAREPETRDDEVFQSDFCSGLDQHYEADSKLVDWSYNVFVPACRTLLLHCKDGDSSDLSSGQVLADMRSLSNTISFFCSEQQRLSSGGGGGRGVAPGGGGVGGASTMGGHRRQGISASISTDRISRIRDLAKAADRVKTDVSLAVDVSIKTASMMSSDSNSSSGFESQDNSYDRSYSVKILRSVSQSLIAPLIEEAEDGFTQELYKSIVQAVQKISWKVEACLAINNPTKDTDVYMQIFDQEQQENLTEKMINALPPEEPKLLTAATGLSSRSNSLSLVMKRTTSSGRASMGMELDKKTEEAGSYSGASKMSPSALHGRCIDGGNGRNSAVSNARDSTISADLTMSMCSDTTCNSSFLDSRSTSMSEDNYRRSNVSCATDLFGEMSSRAALVDISPVRRDRVATFASPSRNSKAWLSFDDQERDAKCRLSNENLECSVANEPHYFRPKHVRRTTVSLSRKEVSKLGWKVAKRADKTSSTTAGSPGGSKQDTLLGSKGESSGSTTKSSIRRKAIHRSGNSSLSELKETNSSSIRAKSASTSNLLDDIASSPDIKPAGVSGGEGILKRRKSRNRSYDAGIQCGNDDERNLSTTLKHQSSIESNSLSEHLARSYLPVCKQQSVPGVSSSIDDDWTFVTPDPAVSLDSSSSKRLRAGSRNSKVLAAKTFSRKAKKAVVQKSLSASEKFTNKVIKTAIALRRGSVSIAKGRKDDVVSVSSAAPMDGLQEELVGGAGVGGAGGLQAPPTGRPPRPCSTSEPPSPQVTKKKSGTMPNKRGTLSRLSNKPKTKSFGSTQSLPRRSKKDSKKSGFVAPADQSAFTDSIYTLSKNAVQPSLEESEDQLLISVEIASKGTSRLNRKRSSIISSSSSSSYIWYEITVTTNMKQFGRKHYTIVRNLKQVTYVYDTMVEDPANSSIMFPERPDKKMSTKVQVEKVEAFLVHVATMPTLLTALVFVDFLKPDEGFGTSGGNSEMKFDLLMTFYTPGVYPGPPGSHHDIQQVNAEDIPDTSSPARPQRHTGTLQKKGTFHMVKNQEASSTFVIKEEGQDALIVSCEEERYMVVAGTFEKLVEQMACEENPDARFVMTFLLGYRHFASSMVLFTELLKRFHMTLAPDPTEEEVAYAEKWRYVIQLRVLDVIMYWLKKCWPDFYRDQAMLDGIRGFIEELKLSKDTNFQLAGTTLDKMLTEKLSVSSVQYRISTVSVDTTDSASSSLPSTPSHLQTTAHTGSDSPGPTHSSPSSAYHSPGPSHQDTDSPRMRSGARSRGSAHYSIHTLPAIQLARQLTLVELEFLKAIDIHELVVYVWEPNSTANKPYRRHIDEYIARFNKLSYWVSSEVCSTHDPQARGALIEKFIEVAKDCKNFNSTISIVSGLSLMAVRRLKKSWEYVSDKSVKIFHKMCQIMSPTNNHGAYRKILGNTTRKDCIPYFGVFMRDITFFNDGNHKKLKNGLFNFSKLRSMVSKFEELKGYQRSKFLFTPDEKLQDYCRNLWCLTELDLYDASENVEPREVAFPATISTPTTPADTSQQFNETDV